MEKTLVRVTLTFDDGSKSEVIGAEECAKWQQMADSQAGLAYVHGYRYDPPLWQVTPASREGSEDDV